MGSAVSPPSMGVLNSLFTSAWVSVSALTWGQWVLLLAITALYMWWRSQAPFKQYSEVPQVAPHWFLGNESFGGEPFRDTIMNHYNALGDNRFGIFWEGNKPAIFLKDLDLIKKVQAGDFDHFMDFGFGDSWYNKQVGPVFGLATMTGEPWRKMKKMITPSFSAPRLKKTVPAMTECGRRLGLYLKSQEDAEYVDGAVVSRKFFMNTVASVVFGMDIDCYGDEESEFEKKGKGLISIPRFLLTKFFPGLSGLLKIKVLAPDAEKFFLVLCKKMVEQRQGSKQEVRNVLDNLLSVSEDNPDMSDDILYRTCLQFFTDGYDTASQAISVLIHHLLFNQDVQERLQDEIDDIFADKSDDEELDQDDLNNMTYLDQVLSEGLRLGVLPFTPRECTRPWQIPGDNLVVPVGMHVIIPIVVLHTDPKYWADPLTFDPERFSPENRGNIDSINNQPFGFGPWACLGQKLAKMKSKILLIELLRNHSLKPFGDITVDRPWDKDVFIGFGSVKMKIVR